MKIRNLVAGFVVFFLLTPIVNAGTPMQVWRCQLNDNVSEEEVMARAVEWKAAATKVPGG